MKRLLTCLLALILVLTCVFAMTACGEKEDPKKESEAEDTSSVESAESAESAESTPEAYKPAKGYKLYSKSGISFAYPEDWEIEDDVIIDENGNNINMNYSAASKAEAEVFRTLSNDTFMELMGNLYEAMGMSVSNHNVKTVTNASGVEVISCEFSLSFEGIEMNMCQFIILGEKKHYTITITEMTDIDAVIAEVLKSITIE